MTHYCRARLPFLMITEFVESPDDLQQRICCRLSNTLVIMRQQPNQLQSALLDVGEEMVMCRGKQGPDSVRSNLFLDGDGTIDIEHFIKIDIFEFDRRVPVRISVV